MQLFERFSQVGATGITERLTQDLGVPLTDDELRVGLDQATHVPGNLSNPAFFKRALGGCEELVVVKQ